ncbi:MAG: Fic family protein [Candidatus Nanoarchaeia archaeon]|nr:Fic family protein [Candidatus Nanoarchaeia archaeon]MDD5239856.1 Fic family protein [Candidatus Nanoarchaeia archaeon]
MVYVYKKTTGGRNYYYLRVSERKGKKVISKDVAYLGNSIDEVKKGLAALSQHKDSIRKAYKTIHHFLESNYYLEKVLAMKLKKDVFLMEKLSPVEACKLHYTSVFKHQNEISKNEILKNFVIEFSFNTTSIEGNTITLDEAKNLLQEGLTPKDKTLREIYDLQNTEKVFFKIYGSNEEITHDFIIKLHSGLMENIDVRRGGYRTSDVHVIKASFDATPAPYVKADMEILLGWYKKNEGKLHPLVLATIFHHKFEKIHPFMDGNGRTGRMLLNYILIRNNYPPLVIHKKKRKDYLDALRSADNSSLTGLKLGDYSDLIMSAADELTETYWTIFL